MIAVLGVDGGQSAIRLRHSASDSVVEVGGVSRLEGDTVAAVAERIAEGWARGAFDPVGRVVLGLTTAPVDEMTAARLGALVGAATGAQEVWSADDAVTSHAGALSGCSGVSLVAGTGVACLALGAPGKPRIIGGHGYLLGDEGGAFWIGRNGLAAVLRHADGRAMPTALTEAARGHFGSLSDLHVRLHDADRPVNDIAHFAPFVLDAAAANDAIALDIVNEAVTELLSIVRAGAAWVGGTGVPVALGGRLLQPGGELRRRFDDALAREPVPVIARSADASALDGAIRLGLSGDHTGYGDLIHVWHDGPPG